MNFNHLKLKVVEGAYEHVLFDEHSKLVEVAQKLESSHPAALFWAADEASAILPVGLAAGTKTEPGWSCIRIVGNMPFGTVQGLIATISSTLSEEKIGVCVVSTFLTDWFFVRSKLLEKACLALKEKGWEFVS